MSWEVKAAGQKKRNGRPTTEPGRWTRAIQCRHRHFQPRNYWPDGQILSRLLDRCAAVDRYYPRALRRLWILLLAIHGEKQARIMQLTGVTRSTVYSVVETYANEGLTGVLSFHEVGTSCALTAHHLSVEAEFRERPPRTVAEASRCLWSALPQFIRAASGVRQRYNVLGAINPLTLDFYRVCNTTYINSLSVCELLRQIASAGITRPITLVLAVTSL